MSGCVTVTGTSDYTSQDNEVKPPNSSASSETRFPDESIFTQTNNSSGEAGGACTKGLRYFLTKQQGRDSIRKGHLRRCD